METFEAPSLAQLKDTQKGYKRFKLFLLIFMLLTIITKAQTADSLIGYWKFVDFKMDSTEYGLTRDSFQLDMSDWVEKMMRKEFEGAIYYFEKNKHYTLKWNGWINGTGKVEEGTWEFNKATQKIKFTVTVTDGIVSHKGDVYEEDTKLSDDTLILRNDSSQMMFKKTKISIVEDIPTLVLACASKEEIAKKWYVIKRELPNVSEEQIKLESDQAKGSYISIKYDGVFETELLKIKEEGNWFFGFCNSSIILRVKGSKKIWDNVWNIKSINETELVLINDETKEIMSLSTKE
ncbi:MAG TPA: hypothetical protein VE978_25985 [Chitinophagales bacterium]|nr:hypothetical protein [Chitinophagales bacterium]